MRRFRQTSAVVVVAHLLVGLPAQARKLKVGISGSPPFVVQENNSFQGISLEVWRQVAEDNQLVYDLVPQDSPEAGIAAVDQGQIDLLVGPISRTGRGITATWMVISLIAVSSLTASLASAFTLFFSGAKATTISSPLQLQQRRVATIEGTSGVELAERGSMRVLKTENLTRGIELFL